MPVDYVELAGGFKPARNGEIFWMNNNGISSFLFPRSFCWHQHVAQKTPSFLRSPSWATGFLYDVSWPYAIFFSFCNSQPGRVLPNYIYNERDPSISNFGDRMIDWFNWNEYFPGFICRCAEKAKLAGYDLIGAQFFGKKQNVTKCIPQLCTIAHNLPPPPPPPPLKGKKFIPFRLKISFYMQIPNWWLVT